MKAIKVFISDPMTPNIPELTKQVMAEDSDFIYQISKNEIIICSELQFNIEYWISVLTFLDTEVIITELK